MAYLGYFEVLLAVVFFVLFYIIRRNTGVPINWPLIGMLPSTLRYFNSLHEGLTEILGRTGGTFPIKGPWLANMDTVATADPANVHHVMSANFPNFPKGGDFLKIFEVLGNGIFNADEDMWKRQRKLARVLINHRRFHQFLLKTSRCKVVDGLIPFLDHFSERGMTVDFQEMFQRLTFDTTCILVTGYDPGCLSIDLPEVQFAEAMDAAEEAILVRHILPQTVWKLQRWLGLGHEKKLTKAWETLDRVIHKYITMKREELSKKEKTVKKREEEEAADLLTSYMIEDDEELGMGLKCDDKFLRDTVLNLMLAGRDTVSSCLTWFFWLVLQNPKVEAKIREELETVIPGEDADRRRIFDAQEVTNLVYLHGALCEALRLYPPVPFQHKEAVQARYSFQFHVAYLFYLLFLVQVFTLD
ncbi:hypothetical protein U1Q18_040918 [Sarracenia purpurea var. burkii]